MNCKAPLDYNVKITQEEILKICNALGVDIKITIKLLPEEEVVIKKFDNNNKFDYKKLK